MAKINDCLCQTLYGRSRFNILIYSTRYCVYSLKVTDMFVVSYYLIIIFNHKGHWDPGLLTCYALLLY